MNNRKQTKRALLTSVMALVMCVVMLVGTTFAWFTDTASTSVNTIKAGNLKVLLMDKDGNDLEGKTLDFLQMNENGEVKSNANILWEPGATYQLPEMKIKNDGDLALKYKIDVSGAKVAEGAPAKSLDLLNVLEWTYTVGGNDYALNSDKRLGVGDSDTLVIKAHMKETANNDYQNMAINGIAITVYATQDTVEYDSTTNQYDKYAQYGERTVRTGVIEKATNGTYGLAGATNASVNEKNITYSFPAEVHDGNFTAQKFGINSTFEGNGATFNNFELNCQYVSKAEASTVVVSNFNVKGNLVIQAYDNDVIINNCNAQHISVLKISDDTKVIIDGCTVNGVGMDNLSGNNKYGIYITRNSNGGTADVEIINSNISNIKASAIVVNGGINTSKTATNFTIKGNTFSKYGLDRDTDNARAAFLIYNDTVLAPTSQQNETVKTMTEAATALGASIKNDNTFVSADIPDTAVVANFFFATVDFD